MAGQTDVVMKRDLKRSIIEHALSGAREHGYEVLGWLTGFSSDDTVYICDAVACTRYKKQSRYTAESDPTEEAELASRFPRNVGIVGLYHSHPFKMHQESGEFRKLFGVSELFHSGTDDAMLRSRSSRMKNYVSIVTDIDNISCYVMYRKKPKKIKENLVSNIDFKDYMRPINSKIHLTFEKDFDKQLGLTRMIRTIEDKLIKEINEKVGESDVEIQQGPVGNVLRILPFEGGLDGNTGDSRGNFFRISPINDSVKIKAVLNLTPTIYVPKGYIDLGSALESIKNEIADYIVYLTWNDVNYSEIERHLSQKIRELEVHLGRVSTKFHEISSIPMKVYTRPKRRMTIKKR
ncbi:MAG: Mov34/MPN/PAD-1 family protein [Thermoplasmata archaeon]|nr:MAG: Mov34/MPN/PAD-1 family protein [Thermoplasmata archaeon]